MKRSIHRSADNDLTDAFRYYRARAGTGVAGRFLKEFERVLRLLEANPDLERRPVTVAGHFHSTAFRIR